MSDRERQGLCVCVSERERAREGLCVSVSEGERERSHPVSLKPRRTTWSLNVNPAACRDRSPVALPGQLSSQCGTHETVSGRENMAHETVRQLSSEYGTHETVTPRFWRWPSGKSLVEAERNHMVLEREPRRLSRPLAYCFARSALERIWHISSSSSKPHTLTRTRVFTLNISHQTLNPKPQPTHPDSS